MQASGVKGKELRFDVKYFSNSEIVVANGNAMFDLLKMYKTRTKLSVKTHLFYIH